MKLETLSRRPRLRATFFFARRSCFTTTISARRRTLVTEPRRHLAALTTEPRSARLSSVAHSHNFSIAEPATTLFVPPSFSHFHLLPLRFPCYEVRDVRKITIHQMVVDNFNLGAKIFEFISWMERRVMGRKVRRINTCPPDIICGLVVCKWMSSAHAHVTIPLDVSAAMHLAANIIEFPFIPRI